MEKIIKSVINPVQPSVDIKVKTVIERIIELIRIKHLV